MMELDKRTMHGITFLQDRIGLGKYMTGFGKEMAHRDMAHIARESTALKSV